MYKIENIVWERLRGIIRRLPFFHKIAVNVYRRCYGRKKFKKEIYSRINQINLDKYLDVSHRPNLNVIILVVDSLRNSRLSCQGYFRKTTPFLDSFKLRYTAVSASPWTYPSVASILTGLYPHKHNAFLAGKKKDWAIYSSYQKLRDDIVTLPELLYFLGYRIYFGTAIWPAYWSVSARVIPKIYDPSIGADVLLNNLMGWISEKKGKRFFAYVQLADLHPPMNPPDNYRNYFGEVKPIPNIDMWDFVTTVQQKADAEAFQDYRENRQLLYDNALRYVDHAIERFYRSLEDKGLLDSTILVITADHGEEFWEHAELDAKSFYQQRGSYSISHGANHYNEAIQVPLIISGAVPNTSLDHYISTVDIMPTVIGLLGVNHNMRFDGWDVFKNGGERPLLSEACSVGYEKKALIIGRYKLIYSKDDGVEWVFDLKKDPQEQNPIVDKEVTSIFVEKLQQMLGEDERRRIRAIARRKSR